MNKRVNFAVIGTNFISDRFAEAVGEVEGVSIKAVYSRGRETGVEFAKKHGGFASYTDLDEMLSDAEVDSVYVASPTFLHAQHTVKALLAGKNVLCEKSIATCVEEFYDMKKAAIKSGRVLLEAMRPAFDPALAHITDALSRLGKIRRVSLEFCKYSSRYDNFKAGVVENAFNPQMKNSALSDIGVYPLWLAVRLFGEPLRIQASSVRLHNGFDAAGSALLDYGEMIATVQYSKITEGATPSFIEGEEGTLYIDKISEPQTLVLQERGGERRLLFDGSACKNNMVYEISAFRDILLSGEPCGKYLEDSEMLMRTMDRIAEAIE